MSPWIAIAILLGAELTDSEHAVAPEREPMRAWSTEMVDPAGLTRFHLRTLATFANATDSFSSDTTWAYEARAHIRLTRGVALSAILPIGLSTRREVSGFLGNLGVGLSVGGSVFEQNTLGVRLGGAFDVYLPTASGDADSRAGQAEVAATHAYEPQLHLPASLSFRGRFLGEVDVGELTFATELGLGPSISFAEDANGAALLLSGAGRVSYLVVPSFEPYVELTATTQIAGQGDIAPPLLLTPGFRFHLADAFDPAVFVSFNFVAAHAVIFGVDLATALRPEPERKRARAIERDDFFDD